MTPLPQEKIGQNILLKLATLVVILGGIKLSAEIMVPFLMALFFAIVLNPLVTWLMRRGIRRGLAISLVVLVVLIGLALIIAMIAGSLQEFSEVYPQLQ
ncbi:MAG TPA: pheromone autoinducer 2 transporter, partial [Erwinia persicina]|nr:pheromone autoinducer 2 transporter [Erwinia persicina]